MYYDMYQGTVEKNVSYGQYGILKIHWRAELNIGIITSYNNVLAFFLVN